MKILKSLNMDKVKDKIVSASKEVIKEAIPFTITRNNKKK